MKKDQTLEYIMSKLERIKKLISKRDFTPEELDDMESRFIVPLEEKLTELEKLYKDKDNG